MSNTLANYPFKISVDIGDYQTLYINQNIISRRCASQHGFLFSVIVLQNEQFEQVSDNATTC